jgi:DNA processing protein
MDAVERAAWLRLSLTPGVGPRTARALLGAFGLPTSIFDANSAALARYVPQELARTLAGGAGSRHRACDRTDRGLA